MDDDRHGSEQNTPLSLPKPLQRPTWGEHIGSITMSRPQNSVNAPADGGTVVIVTVNRSDGDAPTTSAQHDDFTRHIPSLSASNQDSENLPDLATTTGADHEIYSDQLLTKKRGYPLWVPGPGMQLPIEYRRRGTSIGDVGIITSTGEFDFLFNIFHPADHPVNRGVVPQDFSPLSLEELGNDIQQSIVYGPDTYLASSSVRKTSGTWIGKVLFFGGETAIGQRFESTAREAAILIMPNGAASQNLLNTWPVRQAIIRDARAWYRYARYTRGRNIKDGDIRIVVGFDKVTSWGIATSGCNTDQTASFMLKHDSTHLYRWDCIGGSGRVGPHRLETQDLVEDNVVPQNQCVFVRTLNFTISGEIWDDVPSEAAQKPYQGSGGFDHRGSHPSNGAPKGGAGSSGGNSTSGHQAGSMPGSLHYNQTVKFDPVGLGANHPSAALHSLLHEKFPDADMVITEDMDWISVLKDGDVGFPRPEDLCERILEAHELQYYQGVVQIIRNNRPIQSANMNLGNDEDLNILERPSSASVSLIDSKEVPLLVWDSPYVNPEEQLEIERQVQAELQALPEKPRAPKKPGPAHLTTSPQSIVACPEALVSPVSPDRPPGTRRPIDPSSAPPLPPESKHPERTTTTVIGIPGVITQDNKLVVGTSKTSSTRSYTTVKVLGDGSFSAVFLCDWHGILPPNTPLSPMQCGAGARPGWAGMRLVAVKKIKKKWEGGWDECQKVKEFQALRAIPGHPNIIPLYDSFLVPDTKELYFVFESMEGNLYHLIRARKGRPLAGGLVAHIFAQIVEGLHHIHTHGYFHRDMKPENVLVTTTGLFDYASVSPNELPPPNGPKEKDVVVIIKLADLGLARETKSSPPYTEYVSIRWYRAPEVLLFSRDYSNPIDMWALGAIMAELVNLRPLFPGSDQVDQVARIVDILGDPSDEYGLDAMGSTLGGGTWLKGKKLAKSVGFQFPKFAPKDLSSLFADTVPRSLIDCINNLLRYDPDRRLTSQQCRNHPYLRETLPGNQIV